VSLLATDDKKRGSSEYFLELAKGMLEEKHEVQAEEERSLAI
jgi:hypothetical protein